MASLFLRAVTGLRAAAQEELKRIIPLSIIEFKDGSFAATPAKRCIQRDGLTGLKLFASAEGRLDGGSSAVDIANVKQIAVGILTDPAVGGSAAVMPQGTHASLMVVDRWAVAAGVTCFIFWGSVAPLYFQLVSRHGIEPTELVMHRIVWSLPMSLLLVVLAGQQQHAREVFCNIRVLLWLTLSAALIFVNWAIFVWCTISGRMLETSIAYFINPLLSVVAGALLFHEQFGRAIMAAISLAAGGVALQGIALGALPADSLALAFSFCAYGIIKKRVKAEAQTGLLVECSIVCVPSLAYLVWLQANGQGHFGGGPATVVSLLLVGCGLVTVFPLVLFSWAARRLPLSQVGFLQFISPSMTFGLGLLQHESFTPLRGASFALICAGAALYLWGVCRASRNLEKIHLTHEAARVAISDETEMSSFPSEHSSHVAESASHR